MMEKCFKLKRKCFGLLNLRRREGNEGNPEVKGAFVEEDFRTVKEVHPNADKGAGYYCSIRAHKAAAL